MKRDIIDYKLAAAKLTHKYRPIPFVPASVCAHEGCGKGPHTGHSLYQHDGFEKFCHEHFKGADQNA